MKTSILALFIVLSSFVLKAQYGPSPEKRAKEKVVTLHERLNFTPQQTDKVMQIYVDQFKTRDSLFVVIVKRYKNQQAINAAITTEFNKQELETDKKINLVLDNDQRVVFGKYISSRQPGYADSMQSPSPRR
ncbi:hypothetical protein [Daejeonella lutea]|uniref:Uncharacterized protein n=1 Tax=Daejeonella lutea TaxID=572036 RepID=A0A1T5CY08_9SPHI|nr:hypothetical protein [Daejeonella lutea]SKB64233.1 hypothetical protein SAMN05661099_2005 [Daejeonella lutea]